jgi:cyclopropane fatty-acyl-phospholipid synthase-like methyltransferase
MVTSYEPFAEDYISCRSAIGTAQVEAWAVRLEPGSAILDLGCGPGKPLASALAAQGHRLFGVDVAPTFLDLYKATIPGSQIECSSILDARLFERKFDAVLAWGLLFLMSESEQLNCVPRIAGATRTGGRFLFTSPSQLCQWQDLTSGDTSYSLGAERYRALLHEHGFEVEAEYRDEGGNYYYDSIKRL